MTIFGWDASNHDDTPTSRDGIDFYTHKITDGDHYYRDPVYQVAMNKMHALGVPILGSYHVQHGRVSVPAQADWWIAEVNAQTPWWRTMPFIWQDDAEKFDYNFAPTIDEINALGDAICTRAQIPAGSFIAYAPNWLYGADLRGLRYRVWGSDYGSNSALSYRSAYPGDDSPRWNEPVIPIILQYGSRTTIAGQTTSDANAFRGTVEQLIALLGQHRQQGDEPMRFMFDPSVPGVPTELTNHVIMTDGFKCKIIAQAYQINDLHTAAGAGPVVTITADSVSRETAAGWDFARIFNQLCGSIESVASPTDLSGVITKLATATQAMTDVLKTP